MQPKPPITYDDFAKLDLRIATITSAESHPNADRLLKLQIDLGVETRQICAGIKQYCDPTLLVGKQIVVVTNLEPRMIRGTLSNGMLLAASNKNGDQIQDIVLIEPTDRVPDGSTVS